MIHNSAATKGKDEERLIRTVLSRCEIDLQRIKEKYDKLHPTSLHKILHQELEGDFKTVMLGLVKTRAVNKGELNINFSQKGIPYFPKHASFLTLFTHDVAGGGKVGVQGDEADMYETWMAKAKEIDQYCAEKKDHIVTIKGVDYGLWNTWCTKNNMPLPRAMNSHETLNRAPFKNTGGSFWFYVKAEKQSVCE